MNSPRKRDLPWVAALLLALSFVIEARAQQVVSLVTFTNAWRYDQSGTDLGTAWRAPAFDDSTWTSGLPLFGVETTVPFPYIAAGFNSVTTPLDLTAPGQSAQTVTYYFRTHFNLPTTNLAGVVLTATAFADDGCVIYLNGGEAGRARVQAGQNWQTLTTSIVAEGTPDLFTLPTPSLRSGDNVLAVEVHQSTGNSDIAFALSLAAAVPKPLVITNPPRSQSNIAGTLATFSVNVSGGPVAYQWRTNGVNIPGATAATYTTAPLQFANAGLYSVVVSNALGAVTSDDAMLTVLPDTSGPRVLAARVLEEATRTNRIQLEFSERLFASNVQSAVAAAILTNGTFQVTLAGSNVTVAVTNSSYNPGSYPFPGSLPTITLGLSPTNWHLGSNYFVTLNHIHDTVGNAIAPDSRVAVAWPRHRTLIATSALWDFHAAAVFDPHIFSQNWTASGYVPGPWWAQGVGPFCAGPVLVTPCLGAPQTEMGFQPEPTLFRIPFAWPEPTEAATFQIAFNVDDGVVFYLNGVELFRNNVPTNLIAITAITRSQSDVGAIGCQTNTVSVTDLVAGTNWFAAAVVSSGGALEGTAVFGCCVQANWLESTPLPPEPPPRLFVQPAGTNAVVLSWAGSGFALETATNLPPPGAWSEVTNMSNPFTNDLNAPQRFLRLRQ